MTAHASIAEVNQLIAQKNPFNRELITRKEEVWTGVSIDYPAINSHVIDTVFQTIKEIENGQRKVSGITIQAEKGLGKTHVISRLRNQLRDAEGNIFIFIAEYSDLDNIKEEFLSAVASSLNHEGVQGVKQCQSLAASFLNESFGKDFSPQKWTKVFSKVLDLIDKIIGKCLDRHPYIAQDPDLLRAVLWTLSPNKLHVSQACIWLGGKSISSSAATKLGLPADQNNFNAFERICLLLSLISTFYKVVICFDQLEGTEVNKSGFTKAQVIANLAMDLYNSIDRGVILFGVYPDIWKHQIRALPLAEAVVDRIGEQIIELRGLNGDDVVGLISVWLEKFYQSHGVVPEKELYPFSEDELRSIGKQRATVRDVLQWCQRNWRVPENTTPHPEVEQDKSEVIKNAFDKVLLGLEIDDFIENKEKISQALSFSFEQIVGQEIDGFVVDGIDKDIQPRSYNANWLDFKINGRDNEQPTSIGIATIQDSYGRGVQACLKRLVDYEKFGLTRGCLLRSKKISSSASKAQEYLQELLDKGGEWVLLKKEEILPLFALYEIYRHREDEFTEEDLSKFIQESEIIKNNLLIREILSDPSGVAPEDAEDEEAILDAEVEDFEASEASEDLAELDQDLGSDDFAEDELGDASDLEAAELSI